MCFPVYLVVLSYLVQIGLLLLLLIAIVLQIDILLLIAIIPQITLLENFMVNLSS